MLRRILPVVTKSKHSFQSKNSSNGSNVTDLDSWVKIYKEMRHEAANAAEAAVSNVRSDVSAVKADVVAVKADVSALKADVASLRSEIHDIYKQINNTTRILLVGMFVSVSAGIGFSQYLESRKEKAVVSGTPANSVTTSPTVAR